MSFVDLATMALHRRNEMEARINVFVGKCDQAIQDITKLKMQAKSFVEQLNCDPAVLKDRFLNGMKTLDEYIYLITDFNLALGKLEETMPNVDFTPVHDISGKASILMPTQAFNIMDMLSEPAPSTSLACSNQCPIQTKKKKFHKDEQSLIFFSSASCSSESVPIGKFETEKKDVVNDLSEEVQKIAIQAESMQSSSPSISTSVSEPCKLPAQTLLQVEQVYPATIMNVEGPSLWIITDDMNDVCQLMTDMTEYYRGTPADVTPEDLANMIYCAYYDAESDCYCRALVIPPSEGGAGVTELFLVDTGEIRAVRGGGGGGGGAALVRPLAARFAARAPAARCAHLAGIELTDHNKALASEQEKFLRRYIGTHCSIEVDDNSSESVGVYVFLSKTETLNELMVLEGLAYTTDRRISSTPVPAGSGEGPPVQGPSSQGPSSQGPPSQGLPELAQLDLDDCEEYEDPVVAVTGHQFRDEIDICKHYKGAPEKTCFKGSKCTKRHVLKHPDGWTMDRVEVLSNCPALPLPEPGTWHRVVVTYIGHYNRLCVQFVTDEEPEELPLPEFGTVVAPRTLDELIRAMNSPAARIAYKPLEMEPAPGEVVAALYPPDDHWYRARVVTYNRADQNVEVMYIDFGNLVWVREECVRRLEPRFWRLAAQAVRVLLAGVAPRGHEPAHAALAARSLARLVQDRPVDVHVVARDYDEITVEMFDEQGRSVAEQLAALNVVKLHDYAVIPDNNVTQKIAAP